MTKAIKMIAKNIGKKPTLISDRMLNMEQVAEILGITKKTLRRYDTAGKLVAHRTVGGHRQYLESDVQQYIDNSKSTVYLQKEIKEHWSQDPNAETSEEREIIRLRSIVDKMNKDKEYFIREINQIQALFHQMRDMLLMCRRQMLPMDLAKEIDNILRDSQGYLDE